MVLHHCHSYTCPGNMEHQQTHTCDGGECTVRDCCRPAKHCTGQGKGWKCHQFHELSTLTHECIPAIVCNEGYQRITHGVVDGCEPTCPNLLYPTKVDNQWACTSRATCEGFACPTGTTRRDDELCARDAASCTNEECCDGYKACQNDPQCNDQGGVCALELLPGKSFTFDQCAQDGVRKVPASDTANQTCDSTWIPATEALSDSTSVKDAMVQQNLFCQLVDRCHPAACLRVGESFDSCVKWDGTVDALVCKGKAEFPTPDGCPVSFPHRSEDGTKCFNQAACLTDPSGVQCKSYTPSAHQCLVHGKDAECSLRPAIEEEEEVPRAPPGQGTTTMFDKTFPLYDFCTNVNGMRYILPHKHAKPISIEDTEAGFVSQAPGKACSAPDNGWKKDSNFKSVTNELDWTKPEDDLRAKCKQRCKDDLKCKAVLFRFGSATSKDNLCQMYYHCPVDKLVTQSWANNYELFTKGTQWSVGDARSRKEYELEGTFTPLECIRKSFEKRCTTTRKTCSKNEDCENEDCNLFVDAVTYNPSTKKCWAEEGVPTSSNWVRRNATYRTIRRNDICKRLDPMFSMDTDNSTHMAVFCDLVSQKSSLACKDATQNYETCEKLANPILCMRVRA